MEAMTTTVAAGSSRITLDLPQADYQALKIVAALEGKGSSMSSILRRLVREFLDDADRIDDLYDIALVRERMKSAEPLVPHEAAMRRFEATRAAKG